jgi:hypothetical protein
MPVESTVSHLDEAINELSDPSESQCELLREHLESARIDLLGEMPEEYALSLRLALDALNCIANRDRRHRVHRILKDLLAGRN